MAVERAVIALSLTRGLRLLGLAGLIAPGAAGAHSFGRLYNLPVPFWMYIYGATAALLLSFLVVGYFTTAPSAASLAGRDLGDSRWVGALRRLRVIPALRLLSALTLLLCLATGFFGNRDPYRNFNMTFFWIVFVLGFTYLTALVGDLYATLNPWRVLAEGIERVMSGFMRGRWPYPRGLAYWPALGGYMAFIWIELFAYTRPFSLSVMLLAYSALTLGGVWAFGARDWFRYGEFFGVLLRLVARMAPLDYRPGQGLRLRAPFVGLLQERAEHWSLLVFALFMLSSTAFDGLRTTVPWFKLFWLDPLNLIKPWIGTEPLLAYAQLRPVYQAYETLCLLLSPFLYLAVYLLFIALARLMTHRSHSLRELALAFGLTLLPIALVYNITHYYTLVLTQGVKILSLLSDPFGWGWNLFGTLFWFRAPILPQMGTVWHTQVGLILFGHIVSVYLAHLEALRVFRSPRVAVLSQLPMLMLMVLFTGVGLWILAQPIQSG